jgi:hypothetical protein
LQREQPRRCHPQPAVKYLEDSARGARNAIIRGFEVGFQISKFYLEKSLEDVRTILERIAIAAKWVRRQSLHWRKRERMSAAACSRKPDLAPKRAEDREANEARVLIMEASRDRLVALVNIVQDKTEEKDQDQLIDLGEEMDYSKDNVASMAHMIKGTVHEVLSKRSERALDESMEAR